MSIEAHHESLYEQIKDLEHAIDDAIDNRNSGDAGRLRDEIRHLEDDIEMDKNPRDIEDRMMRIAQILHGVRGHEGDFMDFGHADHFYRVFDQLRLTMRRYPNY